MSSMNCQSLCTDVTLRILVAHIFVDIAICNIVTITSELLRNISRVRSIEYLSHEKCI